jgi:hypothetical protein
MHLSTDLNKLKLVSAKPSKPKAELKEKKTNKLAENIELRLINFSQSPDKSVKGIRNVNRKRTMIPSFFIKLLIPFGQEINLKENNKIKLPSIHK